MYGCHLITEIQIICVLFVFILLIDAYSDVHRRERRQMKVRRMIVTLKICPAKYLNCKRKKFEI
jgi:uncharacterized membrane protein